MVPGQSDPRMLRFLATPIIAHGRWAMQSAVTVENAHPFPDARLQRALALNGQFDSRVEARLRTFLETVAGYRLRSENSAEYAAILWGYFFDQLQYEQQHSDVVRRQVDNDMTDVAMGSHSIDYQVVRQVRGRTKTDLDRMAFVAAARQIVKDGGQIAVVGISLVSPRHLFVASHNRPVFVVRRLENDDFMVVSDINAALGLFPQELIEATINALDDLEQRRRTTLSQNAQAGTTPNERRTSQAAFADERARLLAPFAVEVYPLDGEEISALIETTLEEGRVSRSVTISDFDGNPLPDLESFETRLDPVTVRKDVDTSFHETHLREVPERFRYILSVYGPEGPGAEPAVDLNMRVLRRRFGRRLEGLRRLVLVGAGSAFHMAEIARPYLMNLLPDTAVDVLCPGAIEDPTRRFLPQQDLVLMASWSSTTAEMVQLAQQLVAERMLMVGLTEKCFADMALAAAKSAGVMPVYSGEEVTIAGIKSTLCMLLCMHILGIWIAAQKGLTEHLEPAFNRLEGLAGRIENINANADVRAFSVQTAAAMAGAAAIVVVTAQTAAGLGAEVALKLEEASWYSVAQCTAYEDILGGDPGQWSPGRFALVHATQGENIDTALAAIEKIAAAGIPLAVVTCANRHQERIVGLSQGRCLILPREDDHSQVYTDIALYYRLTFDLSEACGHTRGEAPRNRTKSPTVTRARPKGRQSPAAELKRLSAAFSPASAAPAYSPTPKKPLHWEKTATRPDLVRAFAGLRRLAEMLQRAEPFAELPTPAEEGVRELGRLLFDRHSEIAGVVLAALDPKAHAVVRDVAAFWRRLLTLPMRELPMGEWPPDLPDDMLAIMVASETREGFTKARPTARAKILWLGLIPPPWPEPEKHTAGCFVLPPEGNCDATGPLYAYLHLLFLHAWRAYQPQKAAVVNHLAAGAAAAVDGILDDEGLLADLQRVAAANARYQTGFFISPFATSGGTWERHFDRAGCLAMVHHPPGHMGHGPIVTIDGAVDQKYVAMETRAEMVLRYDESVVARWETDFLKGDSIDTFLARPPGGPLLRPKAPFYSENRWYLPVLQPDYDARRDNLIILDMTGDRSLPFMLDELSLIGSRAPRLVIITQQARLQEMDPNTLFSFPISDLLILPSPNGAPIADLHLPLVLNAVGAALAACWREAQSPKLDV
jgi:glucosamine 6-phosphate synthetase-like amidotransferase/phosphosugar isomerase protein